MAYDVIMACTVAIHGIYDGYSRHIPWHISSSHLARVRVISLMVGFCAFSDKPWCAPVEWTHLIDVPWHGCFRGDRATENPGCPWHVLRHVQCVVSVGCIVVDHLSSMVIAMTYFTTFQWATMRLALDCAMVNNGIRGDRLPYY